MQMDKDMKRRKDDFRVFTFLGGKWRKNKN